LIEPINLLIDDPGLLQRIEAFRVDKKFTDVQKLLILVLRRQFPATGKEIKELDRLINSPRG
jgi:hypothetical protein